jgi:uncharacterized membrane protein YcaP (DUF421 family)
VFLYLVLIAIIRFLGKRQLGQMEPSEVVVTMVVADLASISMQDSSVPISSSLIPILAVLGMELILSALSLRSVFLRKLLCGKPVILIENGKFLQDNMRKTRITLDELTSQLREKDVLDISSVQYAILETGGNLSVFPFPEQRPASAEDAGITPQKQSLPITVISDGRLFPDDLKRAGKDRRWLDKVLKEHKSSVKTTWLLTVDRENNIQFYRKE